MGVVYRARQTNLNRTVAVKMILAGDHADPSELVRFVAEGECLAALSHPNIVQVFQAGAAEVLPYLILEYVPGGSLETLVRQTPLEPEAAARLVEAVARGVEYAHERGVVHRDLKPDNVLLSEDGTPKIVDFGLAKRFEAGPGVTPARAILGTLFYMAPEQARGDIAGVGPLADVWAIGAILYRILTGRPPFQAATEVLTIEQLLRHEPVPPRVLQPAIPRDLETIALKCLQKDPDRRYASAGALADDLARFRSHQPILARPVSAAEKASRWCRRNPRVATLLAILAVVVVGAMTGMTILWQQAEADQRRATTALDRAKTSEQHAKTSEGEAKELQTRAETSAKSIERLSLLLVGVYEAADPLQMTGSIPFFERFRGQPITPRQMLVQATDRIREMPDLDGETRAALLEQAGDSLISLGALDEAARALTHARDLRAQRYGSVNHLSMASTYHKLGWLEHTRGNYFAARDYYQTALDIQSGVPGDDARFKESSIQVLYAMLLSEMDRDTKATELAEAALAFRTRSKAVAPKFVAEAHFARAAVALESGDCTVALTQTMRALHMIKTSHGQDALAEALGLFQTGVAAGRTDPKAGVAKLTQAHQIARNVLTEDHVYTLFARAQLAIFLEADGQNASARTHFEGCFETTKNLRLLTHPKAAVLIDSMCDLYFKLNLNDRATAVVREWLETHKAINPRGIPYADALTVGSVVQYRARNFDQERAQLEEAGAIYKSQPELIRQRQFVHNRTYLGWNHYRGERWAEAAASFAEAIAAEQAPNWLLDVDNAELVRAWSECLFRQGQFPVRAQELLTATREGLQLSEREANRVANAATRKDAGRKNALDRLTAIRNERARVEIRLSEYYRNAKRFNEAIVAARSASQCSLVADDLVEVAKQLADYALSTSDQEAKLWEDALAALRRAAAIGYRNADQVAQALAFAPLTKKDEFTAIVETMRMNAKANAPPDHH